MAQRTARFRSPLVALNALLERVKIGRYPLVWYLTGWRGGLIALFAAIVLPQLVDPASSQVLLGNLISMGTYVILALGLNVVVGYAGLLDLGYVAFFVIGEYVASFLTSGTIIKVLGTNPTVVLPNAPLPYWIIFPAAALVAGAFGVLLGAPTLRLRGDYLAIVTLGFGEIVPIVFQNLPYFGGNIGASVTFIPDITIFGLDISLTPLLNKIGFYYLTLLLVVIVVVLTNSLRESSLGRAWVAIREDETAASAAGINLVRTKLLAFGFGAAMGGLGGVLDGANSGSIVPTLFSFNTSITILIMIVLGGIGSLRGVIVGAAALRLLDFYLLGKLNEFRQTNPIVTDLHGPLHFLAQPQFDFNQTKFLFYGVILLVMILLRPQGLLPDRRRQRELTGIGESAEAFSAVGLLERGEAGLAVEGGGHDDTTIYTGPGSDAQGRDG